MTIQFITTTDQDKGLAIVNAKANIEGKRDPSFIPLTDQEFMNSRINQVLNDYVKHSIGDVNAEKILEAFKKAVPSVQQDTAAKLNVDLNVPIPTVPVSDPIVDSGTDSNEAPSFSSPSRNITSPVETGNFFSRITNLFRF